MPQWTPNAQALDQIVLILAGTLSSDSNVRLQATEALEKVRQETDFDNYLLHILINGQSLESQVRASAGLLLKNDLIKNLQSKSEDLKSHLLQEIPKGLLDSQNLVRNITGNVITTLFSIFGVRQWPNILPNLMELASGAAGTAESQEGAMSALMKICEDSARLLDREYNGERPVNFMVPQFIELTGSPNPKVKASAIGCINQILTIKSQSMYIHLDEFMARLFGLATDEDPNVRTKVCTAFASILEERPDKLMPHLDGVINYCIHSMGDSNEEVALEACEFLLNLATSDMPEAIVKSKLPILIPVLLEKMVYSEMNVFLIENSDEQDNENVEDKDDDIKPQMAKGKEAHKLASKNAANNDQEEDSDDSDDEDDIDGSTEWNLRKCSAATMDILATNYPYEVLEVSLPIIRERIVSPQWPVREASILALGAIAEGCLDQASAELPSLIPFLVERLKDSETRVRQITCWTLGRYSSWVCSEALSGGSYANYFAPTFQSIMECALDTKKVVQESACSSLADFIDSAQPELLAEFIEPLLRHFQAYFKKYQRKNLIILYDTVQTFAEKVGDQLCYKPDYIEILLPPLIEKWQQLTDNDKDLWPLLECMSSVAAALGESFAPYAVPVYERAFRILAMSVEQARLSNDNPGFEAPEKDFIVTSLDLIDGLVQGLKQHSAQLIQQFDTNEVSLMKLVIYCFDDPTDDVRQSAYALLGDFAIFLMEPLVVPHLHQVMVCIGNEVTNRTFRSSAACNNAVWALGEMCLRLSADIFKQYIANFMNVLIPLLLSTDVEQTILDNTSITIGRMGVHNAADMGPYVPQVLVTWCSFMKYLEENDEKETSFEGMCNIITANPTCLNPHDVSGRMAMKHFIDCIAYYEAPSNRLGSKLHHLLTCFKSGLGDAEWNALLSELDPFVGEILKMKYGV
ncbi:hypothetical protein KL930_003463 [Ogataea haglerorum]|uniref:Importin N-terminal domain-containing protein n=1 Tax=Ogataea haglerorum TaxID=1937702 RepID=A0AAN6D5T8_9ASCO|nr:hypothetical protein KL951_003320 [Ogataea haglerorum]KAG7718505.1 hypothetical protein KL913_002500 [Ogataea haglerorum]KAG7718646.1 hypothetical protein KL949_002642 [Ogataea haglerorum]KAG7727686.1 hypothetical protein KL933_002620 [Ogataea haglerorum]KAG7731039.1 hypothetical protein KL948_003319 [Ogataea haglerorum]